MKNLLLIIITSYLLTLFGCGLKTKSENNEIFPKESFSVVEATTVANKKAVGSFNIAYKNYTRKAEYPWCLTINIALDTANLFDNGLPKDSESKIANNLEDELITEIKKLTTAHYLGHLFNDSFLDIYMYLKEPEKVHQYFQMQVNNKGWSRPFRYEIENDPNWTTISGFINEEK